MFPVIFLLYKFGTFLSEQIETRKLFLIEVRLMTWPCKFLDL